ncbi:uncharacterized protein C2845_PM06G01800 [Panicum miliaceum]|uniref:Uncharacterized protein n=1 Tax=Panicum miliaceum TaxID=4540 RepID=A0A3L6R764_PANMI|nr:uncharacterized protein C2845_PM06G01800 [Panicum miliaceum]
MGGVLEGNRIAVSNDKYQMIESPAAGTNFGPDSASYLGKSEIGVYSALFDSDVDVWPRFRIWLLHESRGQMEWVSKSTISLQALVEKFASNIGDGYARPWVVDYEAEEEAPTQDEPDEWDFDNGTILEAATDDKVPTDFCKIIFLGFHPSKEIAFFSVSATAVSYHLNTSKVQELGMLYVPQHAGWGTYPKTISLSMRISCLDDRLATLIIHM